MQLYISMKNSPTLFLFLLFAIGVFGDTDGPKSLSVIEGDSVTLNSDLTVIQSKDIIEWRFDKDRIAKISSSVSSIISVWVDEAFGSRLQLDDHTGNLKIINIKTANSGQYTLKIKRSSGSSDTPFDVSVLPAEVKSVTVMVGDSVTLLTGLTEIQKNDFILWMFRDAHIAEIQKKEEQFNVYDERFRGRLELDNQTGSLTITNITTTDFGSYDLQINSSRYTVNRRITLTVIDAVKPVFVVERSSVTLQIGTKIQNNYVILWMFGDTQIARINKADQEFPTSYGLVESFKNRLKLDHETGSLTVIDTRTTDSGLYKVKISSSRCTINRTITVTVLGVFGELVSVVEGKSVTLVTGLNEIQTDDVLDWRFGAGRDRIARINKAAGVSKTYDEVLGGNFKDRLKLDDRTGSLTIVNVSSTDNGDYEVATNMADFKKTFTVSVGSQIPSGSGLSAGAVAGIVIGVILVVAAVAALIYFKSSKQKRITKENGQNHRQQDTDDPDEDTKLGNDP